MTVSLTAFARSARAICSGVFCSEEQSRSKGMSVGSSERNALESKAGGAFLLMKGAGYGKVR